MSGVCLIDRREMGATVGSNRGLRLCKHDPLSVLRVERYTPGAEIPGDCRGHQTVDYRPYITIEADKRSGQPCIRGLRITVYDVLEYLAGGMTPEQVVEEFPELTLDDVRACLAFAADAGRRSRQVAAE